MVCGSDAVFEVVNPPATSRLRRAVVGPPSTGTPPCFHALSSDVPLQAARAFAELPLPGLSLGSPAFVVAVPHWEHGPGPKPRPGPPYGYWLRVWTTASHSSVPSGYEELVGSKSFRAAWETNAWYEENGMLRTPVTGLHPIVLLSYEGFVAVTQTGIVHFQGRRRRKWWGACPNPLLHTHTHTHIHTHTPKTLLDFSVVFSRVQVAVVHSAVDLQRRGPPPLQPLGRTLPPPPSVWLLQAVGMIVSLCTSGPPMSSPFAFLTP